MKTGMQARIELEGKGEAEKVNALG
ncbi:uncharacterized protein G2W53_000965 [Senna tora]|uniref:Uncharacterized protein n=1 Tax=Senna tora TaxID=362788 RepID=A0A834XEP0_9FABA|nr:uncharacterized protein G2W53_000965 [Senna tora]